MSLRKCITSEGHIQLYMYSVMYPYSSVSVSRSIESLGGYIIAMPQAERGVTTRDYTCYVVYAIYSDNGAYPVPDYELPAQSFTLDCSINTAAVLI